MKRFTLKMPPFMMTTMNTQKEYINSKKYVIYIIAKRMKGLSGFYQTVLPPCAPNMQCMDTKTIMNSWKSKRNALHFKKTDQNNTQFDENLDSESEIEQQKQQKKKLKEDKVPVENTVYRSILDSSVMDNQEMEADIVPKIDLADLQYQTGMLKQQLHHNSKANNYSILFNRSMGKHRQQTSLNDNISYESQSYDIYNPSFTSENSHATNRQNKFKQNQFITQNFNDFNIFKSIDSHKSINFEYPQRKKISHDRFKSLQGNDKHKYILSELSMNNRKQKTNVNISPNYAYLQKNLKNSKTSLSHSKNKNFQTQTTDDKLQQSLQQQLSDLLKRKSQEKQKCYNNLNHKPAKSLTANTLFNSNDFQSTNIINNFNQLSTNNIHNFNKDALEHNFKVKFNILVKNNNLSNEKYKNYHYSNTKVKTKHSTSRSKKKKVSKQKKENSLINKIKSVSTINRANAGNFQQDKVKQAYQNKQNNLNELLTSYRKNQSGLNKAFFQTSRSFQNNEKLNSITITNETDKFKKKVANKKSNIVLNTQKSTNLTTKQYFDKYQTNTNRNRDGIIFAKFQ